MSEPELAQLIAELEGIERDWQCCGIAEEQKGNVVKEANYRGTATGLRIAINVLREREGSSQGIVDNSR